MSQGLRHPLFNLDITMFGKGLCFYLLSLVARSFSPSLWFSPSWSVPLHQLTAWDRSAPSLPAGQAGRRPSTCPASQSPGSLPASRSHVSDSTPHIVSGSQVRDLGHHLPQDIAALPVPPCTHTLQELGLRTGMDRRKSSCLSFRVSSCPICLSEAAH